LVIECLKEAVATMIKIPMAGPRAAASTASKIKTLGPLAVALTQMTMSNNSSNPGAIISNNRWFEGL